MNHVYWNLVFSIRDFLFIKDTQKPYKSPLDDKYKLYTKLTIKKVRRDNMKNISKLLVVSLLVLTIVIGSGNSIMAASNIDMVDMLEEEMTAEYLYTELAKKYPENILFQRLAESENKHRAALKRVMDSMGIPYEGAKAQEIEIPTSKEAALKFALDFEKEDIEMLKSLMGTTEDARIERVLGNLLKGSEQHYAILENALEQGIDNLTCNTERAYKNRINENGKNINGQGNRQKAKAMNNGGECVNGGVRPQDGSGQQVNKNAQGNRGAGKQKKVSK